MRNIIGFLANPLGGSSSASLSSDSSAISASAQSSNISKAGDVDIDNILTLSKWGGEVGTGVVITYSFATPFSQFHSGYTEPANNFRVFTAEQEDAARAALKYWSNVADIKFVEVADTGSHAGDVRFGRSNQPPTAVAYYPSSSPAGGDVWLGNSNHSDGQTYPEGGYHFLTMLHEIGHAIGLKHPHDAGGSGIVQSSGSDWLGTSVMSYRDGPNDQTGNGYSSNLFPTAPMLDDIDALQYLYGANKNFHAGADTYQWDRGSRILETIYDAGGTDTISWKNQVTSAIIDLRPGAWSNVGPAHTWDAGSVPTTLAIARSSIIENATGGSAADQITGNDVSNFLKGLGGADKLSGGAGDDILAGGTGNDTLIGGTGTDRADYADASGSVSVNLSSNTSAGAQGTDKLSSIEDLLGGAYNDILTGSTGNNEIQGGSGADRIYGELGLDLLEGNAGSDALYGGLGNDLLNGGSGADRLSGGEGNDTLYGGIGSDIIDGGIGIDTLNYFGETGGIKLSLANGVGTATTATGTDRLTGIERACGTDAADALDASRSGSAISLVGLGGNDKITGGSAGDDLQGNNGNDTIYGGKGNDLMDGGAGNDLFYWDMGNDRMTGGAGMDQANVGKLSSGYSWSKSGSNWSIVDKYAGDGMTGTDVLTQIEKLVFTDRAVLMT